VPCIIVVLSEDLTSYSISSLLISGTIMTLIKLHVCTVVTMFAKKNIFETGAQNILGFDTCKVIG
jgi:hypothetical protein